MKFIEIVKATTKAEYITFIETHTTNYKHKNTYWINIITNNDNFYLSRGYDKEEDRDRVYNKLLKELGMDNE